MCAPSHQQLEAAGWFNEPPSNDHTRLDLKLTRSTAGDEDALQSAIARFYPAVRSRLQEWLNVGSDGALSSGACAGPQAPKVIACSLDTLFPGISFDQLLLEHLESSRVLDRRKVADVPAPRIFGTKEGTTNPLLTGDILSSCSLAACYQKAVELIRAKPREEQASLLDEVRAWPSRLMKGISVHALITATRSAFEGVERGVSDEMLHLIVAAKDQGHHLCITSSINIWSARWLVAEKINPVLLSFNEPPIPLSCVGGVPSLLRTESGELVSEDDLVASLSRYTRWNPSAFGPLLFTDSSCSRIQEGPAGPDEKDIDLALVGPVESSDICARAKRMVIFCDVLSFDPKTSDLLSRMSNFDAHHWVVQPLRGVSFLSNTMP